MAVDRERAADSEPVDAGRLPSAAASALGNRTVGALLRRRQDGGFRGLLIDPRVGRLLSRRMLQRDVDRDEMIAALERELADAPGKPDGWTAVAVRLNGFNAADIKRMAATRMTVEQLRATRAAVERDLAGWPGQRTILDALDDAAASKGSHLRPQSSTIWAAYTQVSYDKWRGEENRNKVWEFVGGSVGSGFAGQNTCATRVSYAFNYGGFPIRGAKSGWSYLNNPGVDYKGTKGDGKSYIVSAPYMAEFLTAKWGPPDAKFKAGAAGNADAKAFEGTLKTGQVAVFAGPHHSGLIKQGYADAYLFTDPDVMPAVAWTLP
ncbi:MAG TPA: T6SS effector amidase Tae4 family protein [Gaiellaceae bacterium]|nr:T6SS effector amidase Tae4 family protein [Gaiellaceae bacterium]